MSTNAEQPAEFIRALREELEAIRSDVMRSDNYLLGHAKLERWHPRAAQQLADSISLAEAERFRAKTKHYPVSYIDMTGNVTARVDAYDAYLEALAEELQRHPEAVAVPAQAPRATHPQQAPMGQQQAGQGWDAFICHASEDKDEFVGPLAKQLTAKGLHVWYDAFTLSVGDSLRQKIDEGLAKSRFGVVVLSTAFFGKAWPRAELDGLVAREAEGRKVILPVWLGIDRDVVSRYSPMLAGRLAAQAEDGLNKVVEDLLRAMGVPISSAEPGPRPNVVSATHAESAKDLAATIHADLASGARSVSSGIPDGFKDYVVRHASTGSLDGNKYGHWVLTVHSPQTIHAVSIAAWHPKVRVQLWKPIAQIRGGTKETLEARVVWENSEVQPSVIADSLDRMFSLAFPNRFGAEYWPVYVTFKAEDEKAWASINYFRVTPHSRGFPEVSWTGDHAPFGWIQGR